MNRFLLSGLLALLPLTSVVAQNPTEILTKAEKSAIGTSSYSELSMSAKRARYTRELDIKSWTHTNKYALIVVTGPERDRGTRYLRADKQMYSFVPRTGKVVKLPQSMLMARRLVEAGARVVTLNYSKWDWHGGTNAEGRANNSIFLREQEDFPIFDKCVSALVEDLHVRGLDRDCAVVVMGEFGRTPKISGQVGRDHWPQVNCALMFGGDMRHGQVIGATDRIAGEAVARPVTFGEIYATLYRHLGIDTSTTTLQDATGRPNFLVEDNAVPLREMV